jgi:hypothetical protein
MSGPLCKLALLTVPILVSTSLSAQLKPPAPVVLHQSGTAVCGANLFGGAQPPAPAGSIDFCKELIIVDPAVLSRLENDRFRPFIATLAGLDNAQEQNAFRDSWLDYWRKPFTSSTNGQTTERPRTATSLKDAWDRDLIRLVAVVNRMDLAMSRSDSLGEGRLIFQLFSDDPAVEGAEALDFTLIVEFDLPQLLPGKDQESNLSEWAKRWHALASSSFDLEDYTKELDAVVATFATRKAFRRIRTNEKPSFGAPNPAWQFREFVMDDGFLRPELLAQTPQERFREGDIGELLGYLGNPEVSALLKVGRHDFATRPNGDGQRYLGLQAEMPNVDNLAAWSAGSNAQETEKEPLFLMAFNTCNGCHHDMKKPHSSAPHIRRSKPAAKPAELSSFLTASIQLDYPLPECRIEPAFYGGCIGTVNGFPYWNEMNNRVEFLLRQLSPASWSQSKGLPFPLPKPQHPVTYRYH